MGCIIQHKKGCIYCTIHAKIENRNNMRVPQTKNTRLINETVKLLLAQVDIQNLHGHLRLAMDVLSKIHIAEGALAKQAYQTIVIKLLSRANCHIPPLLHEYTFYRT